METSIDRQNKAQTFQDVCHSGIALQDLGARAKKTGKAQRLQNSKAVYCLLGALMILSFRLEAAEGLELLKRTEERLVNALPFAIVSSRATELGTMVVTNYISETAEGGIAIRADQIVELPNDPYQITSWIKGNKCWMKLGDQVLRLDYLEELNGGGGIWEAFFVEKSLKYLGEITMGPEATIAGKRCSVINAKITGQVVAEQKQSISRGEEGKSLEEVTYWIGKDDQMPHAIEKIYRSGKREKIVFSRHIQNMWLSPDFMAPPSEVAVILEDPADLTEHILKFNSGHAANVREALAEQSAESKKWSIGFIVFVLINAFVLAVIFRRTRQSVEKSNSGR